MWCFNCLCFILLFPRILEKISWCIDFSDRRRIHTSLFFLVITWRLSCFLPPSWWSSWNLSLMMCLVFKKGSMKNLCGLLDKSIITLCETFHIFSNLWIHFAKMYKSKGKDLERKSLFWAKAWVKQINFSNVVLQNLSTNYFIHPFTYRFFCSINGQNLQH